MLPQPGGWRDSGGPTPGEGPGPPAGAGCRWLHVALTIYLSPVIAAVLALGAVAACSAHLARLAGGRPPGRGPGPAVRASASGPSKEDARPHLANRGGRSRVS